MPHENQTSFNLNATRRKGNEIGATGLKEFSGHIQEEELKQLASQRQRINTYKQMSSNDAVIGAILFSIDMLIRQVDWMVQPESEEPADVEAAEFVEDNMNDMSSSWDDTISEILSFIPFGFSYHEIVYKRREDGRIGWKKLPIRGQDSLESWVFDEHGSLRGMTQNPAPTYKFYTIPIEKALLFRTSVHKGNPEGISVLRSVYTDWYRKSQIQTYESIGIERDLAGLPVLTVPAAWTDSGASAGEKAAYAEAKEIVTNIRRDEQEGIVLPAIFDDEGNQILELSLLTSGGKRNFDTNEVIARYDHRIAMRVMADFLLLGSRNVGSLALASSKTDLFATAIGTFIDSIASVFNRHGIPRLMKLNGIDSAPKLVAGDIEKPDLTELSNFIKEMTGAGFNLTGDVDIENTLREAANLPPRAENVEEDFPAPPQEQLEDEAEEDAVEAARELVKDIRKELET